MPGFRTHTGPKGKYRAYCRINGKQYSTIVKTKAEGKLWEVDLRRSLSGNTEKPLRLTYSEFVSEYLDDCKMWMRSGTVLGKQSHYRMFADHVGSDFLAKELSTEAARKFIRVAQAEKNNKSANRILRDMRALWNWHKREGRVSVNPWNNVAKLPEEESIRYVPNAKDIVAVLLAAQPWERDFINMILKTGARPGEILQLKWDEVNLERKIIYLWTRKRRHGEKKFRAVPANRTLMEILERRWKARKDESYVFTNPATGTLYTKNTPVMKHMVERLCTRAGVRKFTLYSLRHYVSQRLQDSGKVSLVDIQHLLGHQRATTTDAYLKSLAPDLQRIGTVLDEPFLASLPAADSEQA